MRIARSAGAALLGLTLLLSGCAVDASSAQPPASAAAASSAPPIMIRTEAPPITLTSEAPTPEAAEDTTAAPASPAKPGAPQAQELLNSLAVKGRAPKSGYERSKFGSAWSDVEHNGCDTRNDILSRDLDVSSYKQGTNGCVVLTGSLQDPYTGKYIEFQRGQGTSNAVQIDHIVALSDAWQKGAQKLSADQRLKLANDPLNLLAVDGPTNGSKSDSDAASWLPPNRDYWCPYVTAQIEVKHKYSLWVTKAEKSSMLRVLNDYC
ncbi:HNH endonuclease family protein [Glutamicibacter uratoxydans]|nr:HNH endonuclease family protein [Glutamicibacter uratoxydans]